MEWEEQTGDNQEARRSTVKGRGHMRMRVEELRQVGCSQVSSSFRNQRERRSGTSGLCSSSPRLLTGMKHLPGNSV